MAVCYYPTYEIPRPPLEAPLHGLLDTAYILDPSDFPEGERDKWESGISFFPNPISCDHVTPWMAGTDDPQDKAAPGANVEFSTYQSFVLTYSTTCYANPSDIKANEEAAKEALIVGTGQAIEAVLWGPGSAGPLADAFPPDGDNFSLTGSTPAVTGSAAGSCIGILNQNGAGSGAVAMTPKQALLALTQALGTCALGARGVIHASPYLVEDWASQSLAIPSDPKDPASKLITNVRGDYIIGGSGYSGDGPTEHAMATPADGHAWAYATGPVGVILGEPTTNDTTLIDHRTNKHTIIAERTVSIAASATCLFAVYVDVA